MTETGTGSGLAGLGRAPRSPHPPTAPQQHREAGKAARGALADPDYQYPLSEVAPVAPGAPYAPDGSLDPDRPDLPVPVARRPRDPRDCRESWPDQPQLPQAPARKGNEPMSMRAFLQDLRANADPDRFPVIGAHMANSGVSQGRVAAALGVSEKTYQLLERGLIAWTPQRVETLAGLFRLNAAERTVLYRLTLGWEPDADPGAVCLTPEMRMLIEAFPHPTYLVDPIFKLLHHNAGFAAWFPELSAGMNLVRWLLCDPAARTRLADWTADWALPAVARLRSAQLRVPADYREPLAALIDEIRLSDTVAGRLWQVNPAAFEFGDSGRRRIDPPGVGPVTIHLWTVAPFAAPRCSITALIPVHS
jgi:transcriptional regulator with XRE-family HTH domain